MLITAITESNEIVIGTPCPGGLIPVLIFPTWSEYCGFVDSQLAVIAHELGSDMPTQIKTYVNSLALIDSL